MAEPARAQAHVFPCRVYYEDTDAAGVVYYANYLKYAERARSELLRELGTDNSALLQRHGVKFMVKEFAATYHEPARLDDALQIRTRISRIGGASFSAEQRVERAGRLLVGMKVRLACVDMRGRPARVPDEIRLAFATRTECF
jgi:acyl-CoA thioester hydrolase